VIVTTIFMKLPANWYVPSQEELLRLVSSELALNPKFAGPLRKVITQVKTTKAWALNALIAPVWQKSTIETQTFPDWIDSALSSKYKKATLEAFRFAPEKFKAAIKTWENMKDEWLKNDTSFLFINGRWNVNLRGCPRILFDSPAFINAHPPKNANWRNNGVQKLRAEKREKWIDLGEYYYFTRASGEDYVETIASEHSVKLAKSLTHFLTKCYAWNLHSLLWVDFISWCHPLGDLYHDHVGISTGLRSVDGCYVGVDARDAWLYDNVDPYGFSPLLQDTSSGT